ncbi:hypothetical protein MAHJHV57_38200 [Mycobacterium avium subsp. hominissuis]
MRIDDEPRGADAGHDRGGERSEELAAVHGWTGGAAIIRRQGHGGFGPGAHRPTSASLPGPLPGRNIEATAANRTIRAADPAAPLRVGQL